MYWQKVVSDILVWKYARTPAAVKFSRPGPYILWWMCALLTYLMAWQWWITKLSNIILIYACLPRVKPNKMISNKCFFYLPWVCYERSFNKFCLSIWNQLVFNSVVCLVITAVIIDFCLKKLNVLPNVLLKTNDYLNSAERIPGNWNVNLVSVLITSWDIA